jgi:hypothetical protein
MKATSLPHHRPILLAISSVLALLVFANPAHAQQAASTSVEGALEAYFAEGSGDSAAAVLRDAGFAYECLLVAEMLPSEATLLAEVELARGDTRLRYPIKLARQLDKDTITWKVNWTPVEAYAQGLVAIAGEEALASVGQVRTGWADIERVPAFPVIVGDTAFVTPYGRVAVPEPSSGNEDAKQAPQELGKHAQQWVGLTLEDEPGTANVDLLLGKDVAWTRATQALMAPASLGLFRTYLVGRAGADVVAVATAAPVVRPTAEDAAPLVIGMYREGDKHAFRVRIGDDVIAHEDACGDKMTFCVSSGKNGSIDAFEQQSIDKITAAIQHKKAKLSYVMFAATGAFGAGEVARYIEALGQALGMPSSKIFIGYIGEE